MSKEWIKDLMDTADARDEVARLVEKIGADKVISMALQHVEQKRVAAQKQFNAAVDASMAAHKAATQQEKSK